MAGETEFSLDLAMKSMERCLSSSSKQPSEIDLLICACISRHDGPDGMSFEPGSAIKLKKHFGLDNALAFDISNACAGMFTAIKIAEAYLTSGHAQTAMVVSVDAVTALATSLVPRSAASRMLSPSSRHLKMLSSTTIELSTSIPTPTTSPVRVIRFRV